MKRSPRRTFTFQWPNEISAWRLPGKKALFAGQREREREREKERARERKRGGEFIGVEKERNGRRNARQQPPPRLPRH